jgi:catechol 2,3-dioxygenase-like lactoylglutathione lyase family enzyme
MSKQPELKPVMTRGVDHLAIVSDDMPKAMDYYTRVLGFQLVHVRRVPYEQDRGQPPFDNLRHYFFNMGNDSLFAVFEYPKGLPRQNRDHVGGMQHVAFHVPPERFDALIERVRAMGEKVIGPVPLGGRFWSAYLFDPWGTRLEFATDRSGVSQSVVASVLQTEAEARSELETLFDDPATVEKWLRQMPLKADEPAEARPA